MARFNDFKTDSQAELKGVWVDFELGGRFLIAREGNPAFRTEVSRLIRERADSKGGALSEEEVAELERRARANTILLGWEGMDGDGGDPLPYSSAEALSVFRDTDNHDFYEWVIRMSRRLELYRRKRIEDVTGNSSAASSGTSTGGSAPTN